MSAETATTNNQQGAVMSKARAFILGVREFRTDCTTNPGIDLIETYDLGREWAHRLTFRRWDW